MGNAFNCIVYNSSTCSAMRAREMEVIRELAEDEAAYRSLTKSWFEHRRCSTSSRASPSAAAAW
jgi:hypothetical protein